MICYHCFQVLTLVNFLIVLSSDMYCDIVIILASVLFTLYCAISSVWVEHEIKKAFNSLPPSVAFTKSAVPSCHFSTEYGLPK